EQSSSPDPNQQIRKATALRLVPLWRRHTRHGRVLSLDANLGDGQSLRDVLATRPGTQTHQPGSLVDDQRIGALLRGLAPAKRRVVLARASGEARTWTEAAAFVGAENPVTFGERVRRKVERLRAEQERRRQLSNNQRLPRQNQRRSS
ncbi:hypothetical protein ACFUI0_17600, partial [Streptomyces sp. NPDC057199]